MTQPIETLTTAQQLTVRTGLGLSPAAIAPFGTGSGTVCEGNDGRFTTTAQGTIPYASTVNLDMAALTGTMQTISLTGNLAFTSSNRAAGRWVSIRLINDNAIRLLSFPAGWKFIDFSPADMAVGKIGLLVVSFFGPNDTDAVCVFGEEG
jgi:hypothetical protein